MEVFIIKNITFGFKNPRQILNMGGPWVGDLHIEGIKLLESIIINNVTYSENQNSIYFIKFIEGKDYYFAIFMYDISNKVLYKYNKVFDMIFIKELSGNNELIYYEAFHDGNNEDKRGLNLNDLERSRINIS